MSLWQQVIEKIATLYNVKSTREKFERIAEGDYIICAWSLTSELVCTVG